MKKRNINVIKVLFILCAVAFVINTNVFLRSLKTDDTVVSSNSEKLTVGPRFWDEDGVYLILIRSGLRNFEQRKAVRDTWGMHVRTLGVRIVFKLDNNQKKNPRSSSILKLEDEAKRHKDIIKESTMLPTWIKLLSVVEDSTFVSTGFLRRWMSNIENNFFSWENCKLNTKGFSFSSIYYQVCHLSLNNAKLITAGRHPQLPTCSVSGTNVNPCNSTLYTSAAKDYIITDVPLQMMYIMDYFEWPMRKASAELEDVTVIIKTALKYRLQKLINLITTIRNKYQGIKILVADDYYSSFHQFRSTVKAIYHKVGKENLIIFALKSDMGVGAGRNALVSKVRTKYCLVLDDDLLFWYKTDLILMRSILQTNTNVDLVGGVYELWKQYPDRKKSFKLKTDSYGLNISFSSGEVLFEYVEDNIIGNNGCRKVDVTHNFFLARTQVLRTNPWRQKLKIQEHEQFFLDIKKRNQAFILECQDISVVHDVRNRHTEAMSRDYDKNSQRIKGTCYSFQEICRINKLDYKLSTFSTPYFQLQCMENLYCELFGRKHCFNMAKESCPRIKRAL
eukprot:augustus_masked-scaffold_9-processed-gene-8.17-mRNA-1 protein AED:1.00 eAED:1.00 QI:0/-1/0/0/-1/1/1/0/561